LKTSRHISELEDGTELCKILIGEMSSKKKDPPDQLGLHQPTYRLVLRNNLLHVIPHKKSKTECCAAKLTSSQFNEVMYKQIFILPLSETK